MLLLMWMGIATAMAAGRDETHASVQEIDPCVRDCSEQPGRPVCGDDASTYVNQCFFDIASCMNKSLQVAYMGPCMLTDSERDVPPMVKTQGSYADDVAVLIPAEEDSSPGRLPPIQLDYCAIRCTTDYLPVCGSDWKTYSNNCLLLTAACENKSLKQISEGECPEPGPEAPPTTTERVGRCETPCTREYNPVCASNGVIYANACLFRNARRCQYDGNLFIADYQLCEDESTTSSSGSREPTTTLKCATQECGDQQECRVDEETAIEYCADVCSPTRCTPSQKCVYQQVVCIQAPCPPIARCVDRSLL